MINYELAKKLKAAGFPQLSSYDAQHIGDPGVSIPSVRVPTLSELIEACGDMFCDLSKWGGGWWARPFYKALRNPKTDHAMDYLGHGATPEEAVANLWLSLHATNND